MLIFTTRFSKKKAVLIVVALGLAMAALIFLIGRKPAEDPAPPQLVTNEDRVAYLQSLGWEVSPEPVTAVVTAVSAPQCGQYTALSSISLPQFLQNIHILLKSF